MRERPVELTETFVSYITKYALTRGILKKTVELDHEWPNTVSVKGVWNERYHKQGRDWHRTESFAMARAEEMRVARLERLDKEMRKLSAMKFWVVDQSTTLDQNEDEE